MNRECGGDGAGRQQQQTFRVAQTVGILRYRREGDGGEHDSDEPHVYRRLGNGTGGIRRVKHGRHDDGECHREHAINRPIDAGKAHAEQAQQHHEQHVHGVPPDRKVRLREQGLGDQGRSRVQSPDNGGNAEQQVGRVAPAQPKHDHGQADDDHDDAYDRGADRVRHQVTHPQFQHRACAPATIGPRPPAPARCAWTRTAIRLIPACNTFRRNFEHLRLFPSSWAATGERAGEPDGRVVHKDLGRQCDGRQIDGLQIGRRLRQRPIDEIPCVARDICVAQIPRIRKRQWVRRGRAAASRIIGPDERRGVSVCRPGFPCQLSC